MVRLARGRLGRGCLTAALLALLPAISVAAGGACERIVVTGNADYPPLLWVNPDDTTRLTGAAVELLARALEPSGIHVDALHVGTWEQAQQEVHSGRVDMLAGSFLTRAPPGWIMSIRRMSKSSVIFVRRGGGVPYSGWDDLRGKRGTALAAAVSARPYTYAADHLDCYHRQHRQGLRALFAGQADYLIHERHQAWPWRPSAMCWSSWICWKAH